ncbi:hypothetical protein [Pelolinea submarina]|uniref:Uncharacterized protein n=1 Tax=Pelolinea submarina TaxID=913107 RepID=A0A347ZPJ1_9CHLR|nr:hypothetical protein [Pelolinea submarina]REG04763.1 hypothetical protein DFR64_3115 [Pelolinea submarina]BBB47222.1 hypothetical protein Pelsub_P0449 [Pelolinea submarina]
MKTFLDILLPRQVDNRLRGSQIPLYFFAAYTVVSTVRSCIHLLAPDGGAGSVAGMDLDVTGASGIVFAFALWGSAQLLLAFLQLLVVVRYRALVPLMYMLLIAEILLRMLVGHMKPVTFAHTPPGAIGNWILLPIALLMLAWSLWSGSRKLQEQA